MEKQKWSGGGMRDKRFEIENDNVKAQLNRIAGKIGGALDKGWGFLLMLFSYDDSKVDGGGLFYISSAERGDVIRMVQEWVAKQKAEGNLQVSELNPEHPTTRGVHDHWHKLAALLLLRHCGGDLKASVTFTAKDLEAFADRGVVIGVKDDAAGLTLFLTDETEAVELIRQGKATAGPPPAAQEKLNVTGS